MFALSLSINVLTRQRFLAALKRAALFTAALVAVIAYQYFTGAYKYDFYYGDSAGHFVTGVMVADYLTTSVGTDPVAFAEEYYVRSPKVGFGRWPPLFHLMQAGWYLTVGASTYSALMLAGMITACALFVLFQRLYTLYGGAIATASVLLFASLPEIRWHTCIVMSDILTLLFCMLTAFSVLDFCGSFRTRALVSVLIWIVAAILTKENAIHLVLWVPMLLVIKAGKVIWTNKAQRLLLLASGLCIAITIVARLLVGSNIHGFDSIRQLLFRSVDLRDKAVVATTMFDVVSPLFLAVAALGLVSGVSWARTKKQATLIQVMYSWLLGLLAFFLLAPVPPSVRYLMPASVPLTFFVAHFCNEIRPILFRYSRSAAIMLPFAVCFAISLTNVRHLPPGVRGFSDAAGSIPIRSNLVTLVSADSFGEGAFIVDRLMLDRNRAGIVLRGSKMLATSDWHGEFYESRVTTPDDVVQLFNKVPVHYIVLVMDLTSDSTLSYDRELVRIAIEHHPSTFVQVGQFPLYRGGRKYDDAVEIYENIDARNRSPHSIRVPLNHTLSRTLSLELGVGN